MKKHDETHLASSARRLRSKFQVIRRAITIGCLVSLTTALLLPTMSVAQNPWEIDWSKEAKPVGAPQSQIPKPQATQGPAKTPTWDELSDTPPPKKATALSSELLPRPAASPVQQKESAGATNPKSKEWWADSPLVSQDSDWWKKYPLAEPPPTRTELSSADPTQKPTGATNRNNKEEFWAEFKGELDAEKAKAAHGGLTASGAQVERVTEKSRAPASFQSATAFSTFILVMVLAGIAGYFFYRTAGIQPPEQARERNLSNAKTIFFIALGIDMAVTASVAISSYWAMGILGDLHAGVARPNKSTLTALEFWESFSALMFLTLIGVGVSLVRWLNACYKYAKEVLGTTGFTQEKWKTWGWILPIANIFKPYSLLSELYKAGSVDYVESDGWRKLSNSWALLIWWIYWVITHIILTAMLKGLNRENLTIKQILGAYEVSLFVCVVSLTVAGLWFAVAGSLTRRLINRSQMNSNPLTPQPAQVPSFGTPVMEKKPIEAPNIPSLSQVATESLWEQALSEFENGPRKAGLWAKVFSEADGNESQAKARYLKVRVQQLEAGLLNNPATTC